MRHGKRIISTIWEVLATFCFTALIITWSCINTSRILSARGGMNGYKVFGRHLIALWKKRRKPPRLREGK